MPTAVVGESGYRFKFSQTKETFQARETIAGRIMCSVKWRLEQHRVQFRQRRPFVATISGQPAEVGAVFHRATQLLTSNRIGESGPYTLGTDNVGIELDVMGDKDFGLLDADEE